MIFNVDTCESVTNWYPILNWGKLPNFGSCHTAIEISEFDKNYYRDAQIISLYTNICETLKNKTSSSNIRLLGDPGAGKTSFLYAIKKMSENETNKQILNEFYFYIFHINKADSGNHNYSDEIIFHVKEAWKNYYEQCDQKDQYTRFKSQDLPSKDLINRLSEYYIENKAKFKKIMVFVVDDVDLLPGEDVCLIVDCVIRNLEINSVKKWLVLRKVTFENYNSDTRFKVEQFFPDPYKFPTISLSDLVKYRISKTAGSQEPKNPFSSSLCDEIFLPLCNGSLREGLSLLKSTLEDNLPGKMNVSVDERFVQNYLENSAVKTLCDAQKLIDLHSQTFKITSFPIAIDILAIARFHSSPEIIFGAVNDCCTNRNVKAKKIIGGEGKVFKLRTADFDDTISLLCDYGLLKKEENSRLTLTDKGKLTSSYSTREYYLTHSKTSNKMAMDDELYWDLAEKVLDYKVIVDTFITWRDSRKNN